MGHAKKQTDVFVYEATGQFLLTPWKWNLSWRKASMEIGFAPEKYLKINLSSA